ncbi:MAG TPA: BON domain-containing protein [Syntrophomonadaceae bacterium]|nr:BON domain-containing protein [Syntrophomonadaceae bacterium]HQE23894.1 BON domain-containing protein [Syntrophomonadaceae bacterium]
MIKKQQLEERLRKQVKYKLDNDQDLRGYALKADVVGEEVRVEGVVDTLKEKQRVESLLKSIPGVKTVASAIAISTDGAIKTQDVTMEAQEELQLDDRVDPHHIGAESIGGHGTVVLRGHTDNPEELEAAIRSASKARGVTRVIDQVKTTPEEMTLDDIFHSQVNNDHQ